jgi:signal transduction histidine kinase
VCAAQRDVEFRPCSCAEAARWIADHGLAALQWEAAGQYEWPPDWAARAESYGRLVAVAVERARLAVSCLSRQQSRQRPLVALLALLHDGPGWLAADPSTDFSAFLPLWLREPPAEVIAARGMVDRAVELLGAQSPPLEMESRLAECRQQGDTARQQWLALSGGAADWLPALAARLARLAALEQRFDETLQSEKLEALAEFAAGAGHEINNPLTVVAGRAQLLLRDERDPERRRGLALINAQALRAHEMIADMRLFARPPQPVPEPFELTALLKRLIAEMGPAAAEQEILLSLEGEPGPVEIVADPTQLMVALRAVCQNALEAIGRSGHVVLSVGRKNDEIEIRICDDGPGIPWAERPHLFDPFYSARQAGRGLGLGLSKCWRIVANHGGQIRVESQPGHGATFLITLPG